MSEETEFPKSIEEFGYKFNEKGELRNIKTDERFLFYVKPEDRHYNQRHYEELGEIIGKFIEDELVDKYKLVRTIIPVESDENEESDDIAKSRIYLSVDAQECQTLLLLIQGSGVVRPGQWARQVIINDSLELGTMFPYIKKAQDLKWGIVIFNPNENYATIMKDGEVGGYRPISGSESPTKHCLYVWDKFVKNAKAEKILIVAHSYGGICTTDMLDHFADEFKSRVKGIALTDSVHSTGMIPAHSREWFSKYAFNWIKSLLSLNDPVPEATQYYGCRCFSAGHPKHEYTSGYAFEPVFEFLQFRSKDKRNKDKKTTNKEEKTAEIMEKVDESLNTGIKTQTQDEISTEKPETHETSSNDTDTTVTEKPQPDSSSTMIVDELANTATDEHRTNSNSAMETVDDIPKAATNKQTNETSSEKDTAVIEEPQPDSGSAMETADKLLNTSTEEPQADPMEIIEEISKIETNKQIIEEHQPDSVMETVDELLNTTTEEPQADLMEIVDDIPKTEINEQIDETSSEKDIMAIEGPQPEAMEIVDELSNTVDKPQPDSEIVDKSPKAAINKQTNEISSEKSTTKDAEKLQLDPMKIVATETTEKNTIVKNNISENDVIITNDIPEEIVTNVQAFKDDNNSKEFSEQQCSSRSNETS